MKCEAPPPNGLHLPPQTILPARDQMVKNIILQETVHIPTSRDALSNTVNRQVKLCEFIRLMVLLVGKSGSMGLTSREVILARQVSEHV